MVYEFCCQKVLKEAILNPSFDSKNHTAEPELCSALQIIIRQSREEAVHKHNLPHVPAALSVS